MPTEAAVANSNQLELRGQLLITADERLGIPRRARHRRICEVTSRQPSALSGQQAAEELLWLTAEKSPCSDLGDDAGADGAAAFADGETQAFVHRDRRDQLTTILMLSPGITISTPSGSEAPVTSVVRK